MIVRMPDGKKVTFPDDVERSKVRDFINKKYPDAFKSLNIDTSKLSGTDVMNSDGLNSSPMQKLDTMLTFAGMLTKGNKKLEPVNTAITAARAITNTDYSKLGSEALKSLGRQTTELTAGSTGFYVKNAGRLLHDDNFTEDDFNKEQPFNTAYAMWKANQTVSDILTNFGKSIEDLSDKVQNSDILKGDEQLFEGSFEENPNLHKVIDLSMSGASSLVGAYAVSKVANPTVAMYFMSGADAKDVLEESLEAGKSKGKSFGLWATATIGTAKLEKFGFEKVFGVKITKNGMQAIIDSSKKTSEKILEGILSEGAEEGLQTVWQNTVAKIGYDETRDIFQNALESAIGGALGGGLVSSFNYGIQSFKKKSADAGLSEQEQDNIVNAIGQAVADNPSLVDVPFQENMKKTYESFSKMIEEMGDTPERQRLIATKNALDEGYNKYYEEFKNYMPEEQAKANASLLRSSALFFSDLDGITVDEWFKTKAPQIKRFGDVSKQAKEFVDNVTPTKLTLDEEEVNLFEALKNPELIKQYQEKDTRESLLQFIKKQGGAKDVGGDLKAMDLGKQVIGVINNKSGNSLDDLALSAWERGYLPEFTERPTVNDLLDAMREESFGNKRYAEEKKQGIEDYVNILAENLDRMGIDYKDMTPAEIEKVYNQRMAEVQENIQPDTTPTEDFAFADNEFFQFAGERAKTAALNDLNRAKQLEADGVDNEEIRQQTGWFKGVDGKWRFEISDKDAKFKDTSKMKFDKIIDVNGDEVYRIKLGELLEHKNLYKAYPQLENIDVVVIDEKMPISRYYGFANSEKIILYGKNLKNQKEGIETLMHEIQHIIQDYEGFAKGGSESDAEQIRRDIKYTAEEKSREYIRNKLDKVAGRDLSSEIMVEYKIFVELNKDSLMAGFNYGENDERTQKLNTQAKEAGQDFENSLKKAGISRSQFDDILKEARNLEDLTKVRKTQSLSDYEVYERLAGEIEARNTEARLNMTDEQRRAESPESTQDVANADAIVIFDDGTAMAYEPEVIQKFYQNEQAPLGAYVNRVIYLNETANASTLPHELAHFWSDELKRSKSLRAKEILKQADVWENREFERKYKIVKQENGFVVTDKDGKTVYDRMGDGFATEEQAKAYAKEELFARGFEKYIKEGKAPNKTLKQAFRNFYNWLKKIYVDMLSLDIKLSPNMRNLYADILGGTSIDTFLDSEIDEFIDKRTQAEEDKSKQVQGIIEQAKQNDVSTMPDKIRKAWRESDWGDIWKKIAIPLSTRAKRISPRLRTKIRQFEFDVMDTKQNYYREAESMLKKWDNFSKEDKIAFDLALKNSTTDIRDEILKKYNATEDFAKVQKVLEDIYEQALDAGLEVGYLEDYFPRKVIDKDGLMTYLHNTEEWSGFQQALQREDPRGEFSAEEQAEFIDKYLRGIVRADLASYKYSSEKQRKLDIIDNNINQYYADSMQALLSYIDGMNARIQTSNFFGRNRQNIDESIGEFIAYMLNNNEIKPSQIDEVKNILTAVFKRRGVSSKGIKFARDISYIYTMGGINTAITQLDDWFVAAYKGGAINTFKAVFSKDVVTKKDLGLDSIAAEFMNGSGTAKAVNWVFKHNGIELIDGFGKNALLNGTLRRLQSMSDAELRAYVEPIMEERTDSTITDIRNRNLSKDVRFFLFNELSDMQPVSLSELPELYNVGGNARIFYMLKSFMLKRIDTIRNECYDKIRSNDKAERIKGWQNLYKLAFLMMLGGATKDLIIDLMYRRVVDISDMMVNNLLGIIGISKYNIYQVREEGMGHTLAIFATPPLWQVLEDLSGDVNKYINGERQLKDFEVFKGLPMIGRFYYWWIGGGHTKTEKRKKKKGS